MLACNLVGICHAVILVDLCTQDADELQHHSQHVTNRAKEVIAASEAASGRLRTGSGVKARPRTAPFLKGSSRLSTADQQHRELQERPHRLCAAAGPASDLTTKGGQGNSSNCCI